MNEQWMPVVGYEGMYEVSDQGRVRSIDRYVDYVDGRRVFVPGKLLQPGKDGSGYWFVVPTRNNKKRPRRIHNLVCEAFNGAKPNESSVIRHLNGDQKDNRASNLVWGTHSENCHDRVAHGRDYNAIKTHCKRGHPFDEGNTIIRKDGRECRQCSRSAHAARRRDPAIRAARNAKERDLRRQRKEQHK